MRAYDRVWRAPLLQSLRRISFLAYEWLLGGLLVLVLGAYFHMESREHEWIDDAWARVQMAEASHIADLNRRGGGISNTGVIEPLQTLNIRRIGLQKVVLPNEYLAGAKLAHAQMAGATLTNADLSGADLHGADLSGAELSGAKLTSADLQGANLHGAKMKNAQLNGANARSADLSNAVLTGANLAGITDLSNTNLSNAILSESKLMYANLSGSHLAGATVDRADMFGAILCDADWSTLEMALHANWVCKLTRDQLLEGQTIVFNPENVPEIDNMKPNMKIEKGRLSFKLNGRQRDVQLKCAYQDHFGAMFSANGSQSVPQEKTESFPSNTRIAAEGQMPGEPSPAGAIDLNKITTYLVDISGATRLTLDVDNAAYCYGGIIYPKRTHE